MKNVLLLSYDLPSPDVGGTLPIYYLLKHLSNDYRIKLVSFCNGSRSSMKEELKKFCFELETIQIPEYSSIKDQLIYTIKNMMNSKNLISKNPSLFNYYYHPAMHKKIEELISNEKYDFIISDLPMAHYVKNEDMPKVVYALDAVSGYSYHMFKKAESLPNKAFWFFQYHKMKHYEKNTYKNFDVCIVVNEKDKQILKELLPDTSIEVVPNGVNTDYFSPLDIDEEYLAITFVGDMSTPPNVDAVTNFYNIIYPKIKEEAPSIKFYIVGRNPTDNIKKMALDSSVIVTGSVDDVRPYIAKSSLIIAPMVSGTGIKNKILEAMAMQKTVVTTSMGASGIEVKSDENIIIADNPDDFAKRVVKLLNDKDLREKIGKNARKLTEDKYSWEKVSEMLNKIFKKVAEDQYDAD